MRDFALFSLKIELDSSYTNEVPNAIRQNLNVG